MIVWPFSGAERLIGIIGVGLVGAVYLFESQFSALLTAIGFIIVALDTAAGQFPEVGFVGPTPIAVQDEGIFKVVSLIPGPRDDLLAALEIINAHAGGGGRR
jgi:hypothetical protein